MSVLRTLTPAPGKSTLKRTWAVIASGLVLSIGLQLLAQQTIPTSKDISVEVTDSSPQGSPFQPSGQVNFHREFSADSIQTRMDGTVKLKNVSSKRIVAYEVAVDAGLKHREDYFDSYFNGEFASNADAIFIPFAPIELFTQPNRGESSTSKPRVSVTVVYAEFADGSTFGGGEFAKSRAADRLSALGFLNELSDAYENSPVNLIPAMNDLLGRKDFLATRGATNTSTSEFVVQQVRAVLNSAGPNEAAKRIRTYLKVAAGRNFVN